MDRVKLLTKIIQSLFILNAIWVVVAFYKSSQKQSEEDYSYTSVLTDPSWNNFLHDFFISIGLLFVIGLTWISISQIQIDESNE